LRIKRNGLYTFHLQADSSARLQINKQLIVATDSKLPGTERSGTVQLRTGDHALLLDYHQREGRRGFKLEFSGPKLGRQTLGLATLPAD
jgi:hypothetical protein